MNYYSRYPGHYLAATVHLTMEQDGAYNRLLDWCYLNESGIPDERKYSIGRAQKPSEKRAILHVLSEFFSLENGFWIQNRVVIEIEKSSPRIEAARINGLRGGRPKKTKPGGLLNRNPAGFSEITQKEPSTKAPQSPITNIDQEQEQTSIVRSDRTEGKKVKASVEQFAAFFDAYPRRIGRKAAFKAWAKIGAGDVEPLMAGLFAQCRTAKWQNEPQFIPHPATWLNGERWNDDVRSIDRAGFAPAAPSKTLNGMAALQDLKNANRQTLADGRDSRRLDQAPELELGPPARFRRD